MEPLVTNRRVLTWFCMFPADANTSQWKMFVYFLITFVTVSCMTVNLIASIVFFFKFASSDVESALFGMFQICGSFSICYMFIAVYPSRHKVIAVFQRLTGIYRESKHSSEFNWINEKKTFFKHNLFFTHIRRWKRFVSIFGKSK